MSLREYLKELKIDQIEDDTEFCDWKELQEYDNELYVIEWNIT